MKNELMGLLDTYIDHDENCTMLGKSPVCHCDHTRYVAEAHAAIEAWANARFERAVGADEYENGAKPSISMDYLNGLSIRGRNRLRAEARTRYYGGDGK